MNLLNNPEKRKWMIVVTIFIALICNYLDRQLLSILKPTIKAADARLDRNIQLHYHPTAGSHPAEPLRPDCRDRGGVHAARVPAYGRRRSRCYFMAILTGMKIIYNDIIPFKGYKAINLFGIVFARKSARPLSDKNKNHEAIHTAQMRELLYVPFYIVYLLDWVFHGFKYRRITFEQEAYAHEDNPEYLEIRKHYAQWKR